MLQALSQEKQTNLGDLATYFWAKERKAGRFTVALKHRIWVAHLLKPLAMILEMCLL